VPIAIGYTNHFNSPPVEAPTAPAGPFTTGTEVGVPTGTSLTTRTSLGASTGSQSYTITHPINGAQTTRTMNTWENIRFTETFTVSPPAGTTYLFKNCRWEVDATAWCVEVDQANGVNDQMQPVAVFDRCSFQGTGDSNIGVAGSYLWLIGCDIEGMTTASPASGASDGWQGCTYSVAIDCNIVAGTNENLGDPHSDGMQNTGTGHITLYHCWISAGASAGANAAVRVGTEDGPVAAVDVYYCGLDDGGYAAQFDGSKAGGVITGVRFRGNRWTTTAVYGPVDFVDTTVTEWVDNAFFSGTVIDNPAPVVVPTSAFTVGTQVGVPTGVTLTSSSGTGTNDGTTTFTLTHPVSGASTERTVTRFYRRRWTSTVTIDPPAGATWLFDECEFAVPADNWCAEVTEDDGIADQMQPRAVFHRCTFDGGGSTDRALLGPYSWVIDCHLVDASDGWQGGIYSVGIGSNLIAGAEDDTVDAHCDAFQITGVGGSTLYRCWISAGTTPGASQALRVGCEFSPSIGIQVYYCGLDRGGWTMQIVGTETREISDVEVVGCRWTPTSGFGPKDFAFFDPGSLTWTDNALVDGTPIASP
jgi:hypothetical protein